MSLTFSIWDDEKIPSYNIENIVTWKSNNINDNHISIPAYLELNAEKFKKDYLTFIYNLAQDKIEKKSIIEHLKIDKNLSFWWLNHLSEKSPFKSPHIYDCLKLLVLNEIVIEKSPDSIVLYSDDKTLCNSIKEITRIHGIIFKHIYINKKNKRSIIFKLEQPTIYICKALISNLKYLITRWPLRKIEKSNWISVENSIFFCSYFIHLNKILCEKGTFHSHHWEKLPDLLRKKGYKLNWVHHFLYSKTVPNAKTGLSWINKINIKNKDVSYHAFLDSYLTFPIVINAYRRWFKFIIQTKNIFHLEKKAPTLKSNQFLWNYLKDDWMKSLIGPISLRNFLWLEIFDTIFKEVPHQKIGFYLYENQDWESALLYSWHKYGHGKIFAVQHAIVPFWHLYYYEDTKLLNSTANLLRPTPYKIAVNGKHSYDAFLNQGYKLDKLIKVEALRYLYLNENINLRPNEKKDFCKKIKVLIIGDLNPVSLDRFLSIIEQSIPLLSDNFEFTIKAHPGLAINFANYPNLKIHETVEPLVNLLNYFQIAISSNSTSAALEAYLVGLKTIVYKGTNELDLSPLRDQSNVSFFNNSNELIIELNKFDDKIQKVFVNDEFLYLDNDMNNWLSLIDSITQE